MSLQYDRAVLQRERLRKYSPNWLTIAIIGFITFGVFVLAVTLFGTSSSENNLSVEFQETLFEQTDGMLDVNSLLSSTQKKNKRYFSKLTKYANQINHRFEVIDEFIENNDVVVDQKRFAASESSYRKKLNLILETKNGLIKYHNSLLKMRQTLPKLLSQNTEINTLLLKNNASNNHIYYVTRQLFLIERLTGSVNDLGSNSTNPGLIVTTSDRIGRDTALLIRVYRGLLKGDYKMNVSKINNLKIRNALKKVLKMAMALSKEVTIVLHQGNEAFQFIDARLGLQKNSLKLQKSYHALFFENY
ncbi:MAG: hypothetical protein ACC657_12275 [Thiohalomonadales bacterium]